MKKFSLELPKYRLQLHMKLVKRRKPLLADSIVPTPEVINKKYSTGTFFGKVARHISEHRSAKKIFAANFAIVAMLAAFIPAGTNNVFAEADDTVIQAQPNLVTEKGIQLPLSQLRINQGYSVFHLGVDLGAEVGDTIKPIKPGVVEFAGYTSDGYGNLVVLNHGNGLESYYAHMEKIEVKTNDKVTMDTELGKVGLTGHTTGPHLHLEIHQDGFPVNPLTLLPR